MGLLLELSDRSESPFVNIVNIQGQSIDSTTVYLFLFDVKFVAVQQLNTRYLSSESECLSWVVNCRW